MSLKSIQPSYGLYKPPKVAPAQRSGDEARSAGDQGAPTTGTVNLSDEARLLASLPSGIPPTADSVRQLSSALAEDLRNAFRGRPNLAGKGVGFAVDAIGGDVSVQGGKFEAAVAVDLLQGNPGLARQIQDLAAISRFLVAGASASAGAPAWQPGEPETRWNVLAADVDARLARTEPGDDFVPVTDPSTRPGRSGSPSAETSRAIAAYTAVAGTTGPATPVAVLFNGTGIELRIDGQPWAPAPGDRP